MFFWSKPRRSSDCNTSRNREFGRNTTWKSCKYKLHFQGDGNFVLIDPSGKVLWATGTEGRATKLALKPDGNVVLYDKQAKAVWATNTDRSPGAFFALQRDGNFVVYNGSNPIWALVTFKGLGGQCPRFKPNLSNNLKRSSLRY